jgi:hypothetical protein
MDRIRTLLLARSHVVVMDPDLVADAATRPTRDKDVEMIEAELADLGFVMSLDLAATLRRLPGQALEELRGWIIDTLATTVGTQRPVVPLFRQFPDGVPASSASLYLKRVLSWLVTGSVQPCTWCGDTKEVGALDPCGHLVCRNCWDGTGFTGCPICGRRVTLDEPFIRLPQTTAADERVARHPGVMTLVHLGVDLVAMAQERFRRLLARPTPLSPADRGEVVAIIDSIGPRAAGWVPSRIHVRETMAIAVARLWQIAPNRGAMIANTSEHVRTATDALRIACVLMGAGPELAGHVAMGPLPRDLRRSLLLVLERIPLENLVEDFTHHRGLWKRVGERLHPFEHAATHPNVALAFAVLRRTNLATASFGGELRALAVKQPFLLVEDDTVKPIAWAGPIEDALRAGNPRSALARLTHRPAELLRRADHLVRVSQTRQLDALQTILKAVELAAMRAPPTLLLTLAAHVARRNRPWARRVFFAHGEVLRAFASPDRRTPLRGDAIAVVVGSIRRQLLARAVATRHFPLAVIDRAIVDLAVPASERAISAGRIAWPRGSELALPVGQRIRVFVAHEQPASARVELDLAIMLFDGGWRHLATCDVRNAVVPGRVVGIAAQHAERHVDLHVEHLMMAGARHAVATVSRAARVPAFIGVALAPADASEPFEPHAVAQRFDLRGTSRLAVPLTIELSERRLRWLDIHTSRAELQSAGGYRAGLAHIARDFTELIGSGSRPTMWDVACVHAAARANVIYIRERDGTFTVYRRRDNENKVARLGRMLSGAADDGRVSQIPVAEAPTWFALMSGLPLPRGSVGYALDARGLPADADRVSAIELVEVLLPVK